MQIKNIIAECGVTYNHIYLIDDEGQTTDYHFFNPDSALSSLFCETTDNPSLEKITLIGATDYTNMVKEKLLFKLQTFYSNQTNYPTPEIELKEKFN